MDARNTPLNARVLSLDQVRVPEAARIPLGQLRAPAPILQQVAREYRAMA
ncbi:hypothetical protein [Paraburkholderia tropica]|nr:hypothetical protein [Paraburkholderia tropica]